MSDPPQPWLESARRSLDAAEVLHAARRWPQTCFHAQQAAALALKAAIVHQNVAPPRLHSITELLARQGSTVRQALNRVADDLRELDSYYTATRYPSLRCARRAFARDSDGGRYPPIALKPLIGSTRT